MVQWGDLKGTTMQRFVLIAALALVTFIGGIAVASAQYGWTRLTAPCAVASLALNGNEIAVVCRGDRSTILIKQR